MAHQRSGISRHFWRLGARSYARPGVAGRKSTDQHPRPASGIKRSTSRIYKVVGASVAFLGGLALVIWLILILFRSQPVTVILVGADYATNLGVPHNVLGWNSLGELERVLKTPRPPTLL